MGHLEDSIAPMPLTERMRELIDATVEDLDDDRALLNEAFLIEHEVTLDECYSLAGHIGLALRAYTKTPFRMVAMAIGEHVAEQA